MSRCSAGSRNRRAAGGKCGFSPAGGAVTLVGRGWRGTRGREPRRGSQCDQGPWQTRPAFFWRCHLLFLQDSELSQRAAQRDVPDVVRWNQAAGSRPVLRKGPRRSKLGIGNEMPQKQNKQGPLRRARCWPAWSVLEALEGTQRLPCRTMDDCPETGLAQRRFRVGPGWRTWPIVRELIWARNQRRHPTAAASGRRPLPAP